MRIAIAVFALLPLCQPLAAGDSPEHPDMDLRALPRVAMAPVSVLVTVELVGGDDVEEYYCPGLIWDWGDGSVSAQESDCDPFQTGTEIQRRFTARHVYRTGGVHRVRVTLVKADRKIASAGTTVNVRSIFGN